MKKLYVSLLLTFLGLGYAQSSRAQACTAGFTFTTLADTAYFTDASTAGFGSIVAWAWSFGDGGFDNVQNPTHEYAACGSYDVSLTIFTSAFCTSTFNSTVTVTGGITPSFTYTVDNTTGDVSFQPQPLGFNLEYAWDFGDGSVDSSLAPTHNYPAGTYYVCLTVADTGGLCSGTFCDSVTVTITPPSCTTTFNYTDNGDGNVGFQATPFDFDMTYNWDFGDGGTGTGAFTVHPYATAGTYYVCLTAVDSSSMCTSIHCDTLVLMADSMACNGLTFNYFDNNGEVGFSASPLSLSNSYSWDFGDGNMGTGTATSNTYATSGTYYTCVTMYDGFNSCTATYCDSVVVMITGINEHLQEDLNLSVYPNPVNESLNLEYMLNTNATVKVELTDILGNVLLTENTSALAGAGKLSLNTSALAKGAYLLRITANNSAASRLIIKN